MFPSPDCIVRFRYCLLLVEAPAVAIIDLEVLSTLAIEYGRQVLHMSKHVKPHYVAGFPGAAKLLRLQSGDCVE